MTGTNVTSQTEHKNHVINIYIGVGSNIDPAQNLVRAFDLLRERLNVLAVSTFYRSRPLLRPDQPDFINGVFLAESLLDPRSLKFEVLRKIESRLGRVRTGDSHAPRPIDLDILLYGESVLSEEDLILPDPDIRRRAFIAVPLLEIAPRLILPDTHEALQNLAVAHDCSGLTPEHELSRALKERLSS